MVHEDSLSLKKLAYIVDQKGAVVKAQTFRCMTRNDLVSFIAYSSNMNSSADGSPRSTSTELSSAFLVSKRKRTGKLGALSFELSEPSSRSDSNCICICNSFVSPGLIPFADHAIVRFILSQIPPRLDIFTVSPSRSGGTAIIIATLDRSYLFAGFDRIFIATRHNLPATFTLLCTS